MSPFPLDDATLQALRDNAHVEPILKQLKIKPTHRGLALWSWISQHHLDHLAINDSLAATSYLMDSSERAPFEDVYSLLTRLPPEHIADDNVSGYVAMNCTKTKNKKQWSQGLAALPLQSQVIVAVALAGGFTSNPVVNLDADPDTLYELLAQSALHGRRGPHHLYATALGLDPDTLARRIAPQLTAPLTWQHVEIRSIRDALAYADWHLVEHIIRDHQRITPADLKHIILSRRDAHPQLLDALGDKLQSWHYASLITQLAARHDAALPNGYEALISTYLSVHPNDEGLLAALKQLHITLP
jgi:hypothetical protein